MSLGKFFSKFGSIIIGTALVVAGVFLGPEVMILGVSMIIQGTLNLLLKPNAPARSAQEMSLALGEQPRVALFGETATAGSLVDGFNYGGKYGTDWEVLGIRLADHKCDGLVGFYVDDEYVEYTGDGNYPQFDGDHFEIYFRADTTNDPLPSIVTTYGPGWTSADIGESGCDVWVAYRADGAKAKKLAWPGGRPRFLFVVRGKLCYDPGLDDTAGGSGAHRWNDSSTWDWSENPAVCRYNWVRGIYTDDDVTNPSGLLIGRGLSIVEAPPTRTIAAADICDELVDGDPLYRVAGPVYADQEFLDVEEMFAAACAGSVVTREGSVELEPGVPKSVVASFTDDDIVVGTEVSWNQGILSQASQEWVNTVVARYVEPSQKWNDHAAPVVRNTADILADGRPREGSITLRLVRHQAQALRIAEITRRMGRRWGRLTVTLGPRFCQLEDGDWITYQSDRRFGGETTTFRVEAFSLDKDWRITLTLREISEDCFTEGTFDQDLSEVNIPDAPPDIGMPEDTSWTLTATTLTSAGASIPAVVFTGESVDDDYASEIIFEIWKDDGAIDPTTDPDDPDWETVGSRTPVEGSMTVTSTAIEPGADYFGAVTYVVAGEKSDRLVLGPVTVADLDVSGQIDPAVAAAVAGLSWKQPVRFATTAPGTLATSFENGDTVDGVVIATGDRGLIKDQAAATENGIYVVNASGAPTRATDADTGAELLCAAVRVSEGTANADTTWFCTNNATITVGATNLAFAQAAAVVSDGDKGDIVVTSSGSVWTIDNGVVTNAKLADMAAHTIKARKTNSTGAPENATLSEILDFIGSAAQGDILYRGASDWARLGAGSNGQFLKTLGGSADPAWATISSGSGGGGRNVNLGTMRPLSDFSQINISGNHTATEVSDKAITIADTSPDTTIDIIGLRRDLPSTTCRVAVFVQPTVQILRFAGVCFGFSDGTKYRTVTLWQHGNATNSASVGNVEVANWSNKDTRVAEGTVVMTPPFYGPATGFWVGLRVNASGTPKAYYEYSADGVNFTPLIVDTQSTDYLGTGGYTKAFVGLFTYNQDRGGTDYPSFVSILDWDESGLSRGFA